MICTGNHGFFVLLLSLAAGISLHQASGTTIIYLDEEGRIVARPPPGMGPLAESERNWWSDTEVASVAQEGPTGGVVSMRVPQKPLQASVSATVTGSGCTFSIINADSPGEGFNDPTPVSPVGGNPGTTLGQQRMNALLRATEIWAEKLDSGVPIVIEAAFDEMLCDATAAIAGGASLHSVHRDFVNAPRPATWYVAAQANALAGTDLAPSFADIPICFNVRIDQNCLPGISWYYGFDLNCPPNQLDFITLALHELCHSLGFFCLVAEDGERHRGYDDVFMVFLRDVSSGKSWPEMTDSERATSAIDTDDLVWTGSGVNAASSFLTAGRHATSGQVMMFAPATYQPASSVSHFTDECYPHQLMEPSYNEVIHEPDLCLEMMIDIGWPVPQPVPVTGVGHWSQFD